MPLAPSSNRASVMDAGRLENLAQEAVARCRKLATFSEDLGSTRRTFLCAPMQDVHHEIAGWLRPLGITPSIDAAGNLRASYPADSANASRLLIGSHLDTVPNAGAFDGVLGVVLSIALLQALEGRRLPYAIDLAGFSEEEGVRFGRPFIGSRAVMGRVDEELLDAVDANGVSVRSAIKAFGLDPSEIPQARIESDTFAYLEFHIEQGPVLEHLNLPLAAVEAIAGQTRMDFTFLGRANHAGTTPMNLRFDAIAAAAEWIGAVESKAKSTAGLVATVGSVHARPGATNVIAAEAQLTLDVRHSSDEVRIRAVGEMTRVAEEIAKRRGLSVCHATRLNQSAVAMNPFLIDQIEAAIGKTGLQVHRMPSGAGHDAMILAEKVPAAMIFLRTLGGISHDPAESVNVEDVAKAVECGLHLLDQLSAPNPLSSRTSRA